MLYAFTQQIANAQSTVDEGLPPGWENWEAECGQPGGLHACQNLGKIWVFGVERPVNLSKAAEYFYKGCSTYKDLETCAMTIEYARDQAPNPDLYEKTLNIGCRMKAFRYCIELYDTVRPSPVMHKLSLGAACGAGDPDVCNLITILYSPRRKPKPTDPVTDIDFALKWGKKGCALGSGYACKQVGKAYAGFISQPPHLPKDTEEGLKWFRKACQLKDGNSCSEIIDYAVGVAKNLDPNDNIVIQAGDISMALEYGCADNFMTMCYDAAQIFYAGGYGISVDKTKATKYALQACYTDNRDYKGIKMRHYTKAYIGEVCDFAAYLAGEAYEKTGKLTFDDITAAKRGCEFDNALACYRLARAQVIHERYDAANISMRKSCTLGENEACEWVESEEMRIRKEEQEKRERAERREQARLALIEEIKRRERSYQNSYTPASSYSSYSSGNSYIAPNTNRSYAAQESSAAIYNRVRVQTKQYYCNTGGTYGC